MDLQREREMSERLARLEQKVEFLLRELGLEEKAKAAAPRVNVGEVEEMLRNGNKLGAVRHYRERTGADLAEAAKAVEQIEQDLRR